MTRFHADLVAVLVLASAGWAHGAEATAPAQPRETAKSNLYVRLLRQLYLAGQPDAVMVGVRSGSESSELDLKARAQVAVLEGMVQIDLVQEQAARDAFWRAMALDYDAALPGDASTKAAELFQAIRTEYQRTHKRPPAPPKPEADPSSDAWKWGLMGGGALGALIGIAVLASSNGQQGAPGGLLIGAGAATAVGGFVALVIPVSDKARASVSLEISPRGSVAALCTAHF